MSVAQLSRENELSAVGELRDLRGLLIEERQRVEVLIRRVEKALKTKPKGAGKRLASPQPSSLDSVRSIIAGSSDLRLDNGKLSAERIAKVFGISLSQLGGILGRSKQALSKTPDSNALQPALGYFERVARLRLVTENDAEFRKWLRMPNETLLNQSPLGLLQKGRLQEIADKVNDMLTGMPA